MKAIKNKKRFDARRFLSERKEETKENVEKTNANFNSFSLDNWLEESSVKEVQIGDGVGPEYTKTGQAPVGRDGAPVEEDCGGPEVGPEEPQAVPADLSPDEAFGAGYTSAVEEIMASIQGLLEDPMDMGPAGEEEESALVVTQLPEAEEHEDGRSTDPIKTLEKEWDDSIKKTHVSSAGNIEDYPDYLLNIIRGDIMPSQDMYDTTIPVFDYIEGLDEKDIDTLIDRFQNEKEALNLQKPHIYKLIMAIVAKRAHTPVDKQEKDDYTPPEERPPEKPYEIFPLEES